MIQRIANFGRLVKKVSKKYQWEIENVYGFKLQDIGVHSWRKCALTKLNCGSTARPSAASACIQGGHSMGRNRDVYIVHGKAANNYCAIVRVGLPVNHDSFAVSYIDVIGVVADQSLNGGVEQDEYNERQATLDNEVDKALESIFGVEHLEKSPHLRPLLRKGLLSHLHHRKSYDDSILIRDRDGSLPVKLLPKNSPLRATALFTNPRVEAMRKYTTIAMPWEEDKCRYFKQPTGIPPHSLLLGYVRGLKDSFEALPSKLEAMLDRRKASSGLALDQIVRAVEEAPQMSAMLNDIASIKRMMADGGVAAGGGTHSTREKKQRSNDVVVAPI